MKRFSIIILNVIILLSFFDFTGDSIIRSYSIDLVSIDYYYKLLVIFLFFVLVVLNFRINHFFIREYVPFFLILLVVFYGLILGIINNDFVNVVNDAGGYMFIFLVPIISNINTRDYFNERTVLKYIKIFIVIIVLKIVVYQILTIVMFGVPSYKILLKQSPYFLIIFSILLEKILKKEKGLLFSLLVTCFILFVAMARMIFIAMIFIFFIQYIRNFRVSSFKNQLFSISVIVLSFILYVEIQTLDYIGTFDRLYGGTLYEEGLDYRAVQFQVILQRFYDYPLGVGFGYYTPNYLSYGELAKPYLLELDLLNFFSKVGAMFSLIYIYSYVSLFFFFKKNIFQDGHLYFSFFVGILSLLVYSLGQTLHQGFLYWVCYSIFYSMLLNYKKFGSTLAIMK